MHAFIQGGNIAAVAVEEQKLNKFNLYIFNMKRQTKRTTEAVVAALLFCN
jgi:hypothetical protein